MVYYLTLLPRARIGIVGASWMSRRSPSTKEQLQKKTKLLKLLKLQRPDIRRLGSRAGAAPTDNQRHQRADIRCLANTRTSSLSPGNPASTTEHTRSLATSAQTSGLIPGHPAPPEAPDIRPPAWASDTCACTAGPEAHVSLSHLPLRGLDYI